MKNYLIVKHGALGDVVRNSFFAEAIKKHDPQVVLHWVTKPICVDLLKHNPFIDVIYTSFDQLDSIQFDCCFSLDDELDVVREVAALNTPTVGAFLDSQGQVSYTPDASEWFDMGLISRYGKETADTLKKLNQSSHAEIFSRIFGTKLPAPRFYLDPDFNEGVSITSRRLVIGINPFAGERWPSKELPVQVLFNLIQELLKYCGVDCEIRLLGAYNDFLRNQRVVEEVHDQRVFAVNSDRGLQEFAYSINQLDLLVTSDSLALHLANGLNVPWIAFFSPTSAAEIDSWGRGIKLISHSSDYCSYAPLADNSSITVDRLMASIKYILRQP
jgi:heptosyltransferase-2